MPGLSPEIVANAGAAPAYLSAKPLKSVWGNTPLNVDDSLASNYGTTPWQAVFNKGAKALAPYASNLINSFRKPPMPIKPGNLQHLMPARINLDASRVDIARALRGQQLFANRNLDANTAAAVGMAGVAQGTTALNGVNAQEANTNAQLKTQTDQANASIDAQNLGLTTQYNNNLTERQVAQQRAASANIANASDKYIAQEESDARRALDLEKTKYIAQQFSNSGVWNRMVDRNGEPVKLKMGGKLKKVYC